MFKRGISPLIATVLVIGFTVALGAVIILWGGDFIDDMQESAELGEERATSCADAMFDVENVQQTSIDEINFLLENTGQQDIKSIIVRLSGSKGTASKTLKGIGSANKQAYSVKGFVGDSGSPLSKLAIIPTMDVRGKPNVCTPGMTLEADISEETTSGVTEIKEKCGNGTIDSIYEECDGADLNGQDCLGLGYTGGTLGCDAIWCVYDTSSCTVSADCGNGVFDAGEDCEIDEFGLPFAAEGSPTSCQEAGYEKGDLYCSDNCKIDTTYCEGAAPETCGDNTIDPGETCDGTDLSGENCISQGFTGGTLTCQPDCMAYDTTGCTSGPVCGDNTAEGAEVCDGTDLLDEDCISQGFISGDLACQVDCAAFDTSGCASEFCGNNIREGTEICDGTDLSGEDCISQGFISGDLACQTGCAAFDTTGCTPQICGNDVKEGTEECDGTDLGGATCSDVFGPPIPGCYYIEPPICYANCTFPEKPFSYICDQVC